jgi:arginine/lysine/histidine/glutamine transport system ATP-binding protein
MNNTIPAIIFDNIEKNFGFLKVLKGIIGEINRGEVVAVIGSSPQSDRLRIFLSRLKIIRNS